MQSYYSLSSSSDKCIYTRKDTSTQYLVVVYIPIAALYEDRVRFRVEDELVKTNNAGVFKRQINVLQDLGKEESDGT